MSPPAAPIAVYLADDHPAIRETIAREIQRTPELRLVGEAGEGLLALREIRELHPDVAVLDLEMPGMGGIQVLEALRLDADGPRVLVLTGYADSASVYSALGAGASGCVIKTASTSAICDAILAAARGETVISPEFHAGLVAQIHLRSADEGPVLSERELEVLTMTAAGKGAREIAAELHLSPATIRTHLQHVYEKLGVGDRAAAVAEGIRRGLIG